MTTVVFTATDDCGNASTTTATFTVEDTTAPELTTPAVALNLECSADDQQSAINDWLAINGGASSVDQCSDTNIVWTNNYTVGSDNTDCGASGTVLVTFTATDDCGLFITTTAAITIEDTTAPTLSLIHI